jgi:uncharacterized protein YegJ (DUF2314 family)
MRIKEVILSESVNIPYAKDPSKTYGDPVQRYWYHNPMHRGFTSDGGIAAYTYKQNAASDRENEMFKHMVYLSPTPIGNDAVKIDITKLPNFNHRTFQPTGQAEGYHIYRGNIPASAIVREAINEGLNHPIIVVDVQPAYDTPKSERIIKFVNKNTGPVLMFVNAEETGITEDTVSDIQLYWENTIVPEEERYTYDEEYDDYVEVDTDDIIDWQRFRINDKGYGYFRCWMDGGMDEGSIIKTIREMYIQKVTDSRELFAEEDDYSYAMEQFLGSEWDDKYADDNLAVNWTSVAQLKRYNGAYIVGGGRSECLREVELLMNAFNIKYKRIDSLVYG